MPSSGYGRIPADEDSAARTAKDRESNPTDFALETCGASRTSGISTNLLKRKPVPTSRNADAQTDDPNANRPDASNTTSTSIDHVESTILRGSSDGSSTEDEKKSTSSRSLLPAATVERSWKQITFGVLVDLLLLCAPLMFLVMAGMVAQLDGQPVSKYGDVIVRWTLIGPTIFPIAFAALVGRSLKNIAAYKLRNGTSLGLLEQLLGSQTVFGTLHTAFSLRIVNTLVFALTILWTLSPLGGQSSLRLLATQRHAPFTARTLAYFTTNQSSLFDSTISTSLYQTSVQTTYIGTLLGSPSTKNASQDNWGNIKIPSLRALEASNARREDGWLLVPETEVTYSSLLGIPVAGIPSSGSATTNFTIHSYYHDYHCSKLGVNTTADWYNHLGKVMYRYFDDGPFMVNSTSIWETTGQGTTFLILPSTQASAARMAGNDTSPVYFMWVSLSGNTLDSSFESDKITIANCSLSPTFVTSYLSCTGPQCRVAKMKEDSSASAERNFDGLMVGAGETDTWGLWPDSFANAMWSSGWGSSGTERYIWGEEKYPFATGMGYVPLYELDKDVFAQRLGVLANTYWLSSLTQTSATGSALDVDPEMAINGSLGSKFVRSDGVFQEDTMVYTTRKLWLCILIVASSVLFIVGISGVILQHTITGPDILGYASTLTRDNPYTPEYTGGSALDGLTRARLLRKGRIVLEDVREGQERGLIAVAQVPEPSSSMNHDHGKLAKGRLYI